MADDSEASQGRRLPCGTEEIYRSLIDAMEEGVVLQDVTGAIVAFNESALQVLGLTAEQLLGKTSKDPHWRVVHDDGSPFETERHPAVITLRTGVPQSRVIMGVHKLDGELRWLSVNSRPLGLESGSPQAVLVTLLDVTENRRAEERLRASELQLRTLVDNAPVGIVLMDPSGSRTFVNDRWTELTGMSREAAMFEGWSRAIHPDDRDAVTAAWQHAVQNSRVFSMQYRYLTPDGRVVHVDGRACAIASDSGERYGFMGTVTDLTERRRAEEERDRFFALSMDILCTAGMDGYFKTVNPAFSATVGYSSEELLSQPFFALVHPDDLIATEQCLAQLAEGKDSVQFENRYRCKDGSWKWMSWNTPAQRPGDEILYAVARDVTDQKRAKQALADAIDDSNRERQRFEQMTLLSPSTVYILDFKTRVPTFTNRNVAISLGYTEEEMLAFGERIIEHLSHPDDDETLRQRFEDLAKAPDGFVVESIRRLRHASGRWLWTVARETVLSRYPDGSPREILGNASDITALKEAEQRLDALASTDSLTGLANNRVIRERLEIMLAESRRGRRLAFVMLDVDDFKLLNDTYGHAAGDQALVQLARVLSENVRATDLVGRYGGEEFCVLVSDVDESAAILVAEKLRVGLHAIKTPCRVTASFGVAMLLAADGSIKNVMERADRALYIAKQSGRDRVELSRQVSVPAAWDGVAARVNSRPRIS